MHAYYTITVINVLFVSETDCARECQLEPPEKMRYREASFRRNIRPDKGVKTTVCLHSSRKKKKVIRMSKETIDHKYSFQKRLDKMDSSVLRGVLPRWCSLLRQQLDPRTEGSSVRYLCLGKNEHLASPHLGILVTARLL